MTTSIRLEPAFEKRLDHRAAVTGRMKALYLPELVARGLDDLQDYFLADATMARVRSGQEQVFSWDQVERRLGLAWLGGLNLQRRRPSNSPNWTKVKPSAPRCFCANAWHSCGCHGHPQRSAGGRQSG